MTGGDVLDDLCDECFKDRLIETDKERARLITPEQESRLRRNAASKSFGHAPDGGILIESNKIIAPVLTGIFDSRPEALSEAVNWSAESAGALALGLRASEIMDGIEAAGGTLELPTAEQAREMVDTLCRGESYSGNAFMLEILVVAIARVGGPYDDDNDDDSLRERATEAMIKVADAAAPSAVHYFAFKMWWQRANITLSGLRESSVKFDRERAKRFLRRTQTYRRMLPKVSRNDPCFCGSGKKYKKCCGR